MAKIGTLTWHINENYGALLQAYALQYALKELGYSSELIDYWYLKDIETAKSRNVIRSLLSLCTKTGRDRNRRHKRSRNFKKKYIPISDIHYHSYDELRKCTGYDAYICGSDQIWNPDAKNSPESFRLDFVPETSKRISYAVSFGVSSLPLEFVDSYRRSLQKFDAISVREKEGAQIVEEVADRKAELVLDPTLLLTRYHWTRLANEAAKMTNGEEYILCYFLGGDFGNAKKSIADFRKYSGLPFYCVGGGGREVMRSRVRSLFSSEITYIADAGPLEFLNLILNASCVITNSFHGTVFSVLFHKPFYSIVDSHNARKRMSSRLWNFLSILRLEEGLHESNKPFNEKQMIFDHVESILAVERKKSIEFLKNALGDI